MPLRLFDDDDCWCGLKASVLGVVLAVVVVFDEVERRRSRLDGGDASKLFVFSKDSRATAGLYFKFEVADGLSLLCKPTSGGLLLLWL
jgi:hypothetical protein